MEIFLDILNKLPAIISFAILFSIIVLFSFVIRWLWTNVLLRLSEKTPTNLDKYLFLATKGAAQLVFIAAGLQFSWKMYGDSIFDRLNVITPVNTDYFINFIEHLCSLFLAFTVILFFWKALLSVIKWYEKDVASKTDTHIDEKIMPTVRKILNVSFFIFIIMFISDHFDLPLSKLWAAAGIGSLAIALAARDTFANIISGVIMLIDRPFLIGDRIELTDGTFGDVVDIGMRSTKILSFDNTIYILPNAEISNQRITNHCYPDYKIKIRHNIGVAYGSDLEKVKEIINDILNKHPDVLNNPTWGIYFMNFGDSSLDLLVIYWVNNYRNKLSITDEINMEIKKRFEEENIEIPFPQRELHMKKDD